MVGCVDGVSLRAYNPFWPFAGGFIGRVGAVKLIVQIPCYNEQQCLPETLADLPEEIPGIDSVETLVVDDGSEDATVHIARRQGVDHVVALGRRRGLAGAWRAGIESALRAGADIIVNTDADNQYEGADVEALVRPILNGEADMVIGERPIGQVEHFSWLKKRLQRLGSWTVSRLAGVKVPDAASGFRAYSRDAAMRLNLNGSYSHCLETIIRAARSGIAIRSVPVRTNPRRRPSRLMKSTLHYLVRQSVDIVRAFTMVRPLRVFGLAALLLVLLGVAGCVRFLIFFFSGGGAGHVQSVVLSAMLVIVGFVVGMIGLAADMISANRRLIEESLYRLKKLEMDGAAEAQPARREQS
ncbi:MAG: glycosyltransferase family 2 protein [Candidatus Brocadiia bacterium]